MPYLLLFTLVGFFAQIIDGSLGMAFGAASSSLLLMFGIAPVIVSATIHFAEIFTTAASGASHWKFGNVDKSLLLRLSIPGGIAAFVGAALLSNINGALVRPIIAIFLFIMGIYIVYLFLFRPSKQKKETKHTLPTIFLIPLGFVAGLFDSIGGGGWGTVNTPLLLSKKGAVPRKVIGTVSASEFVVTISASLGFLIFFGWSQINWFWVGAFALGGVLAAPIAAWLVKVIPTKMLGVIVGSLIVLTNGNILLRTFVTDDGLKLIFYTGLLLLLGVAVYFISIRRRQNWTK